jgi:hypothetical protein
MGQHTSASAGVPGDAILREMFPAGVPRRRFGTGFVVVLDDQGSPARVTWTFLWASVEPALLIDAQAGEASFGACERYRGGEALNLYAAGFGDGEFGSAAMSLGAFGARCLDDMERTGRKRQALFMEQVQTQAFIAALGSVVLVALALLRP